MNTILFVVTGKENKETIDSINQNKQKGDKVVFITDEGNSIYKELLKEYENEFDYICIVPSGSTLAENYRSIMEEYMHEEKTGFVYLPLTVLVSEDVKGVLNTCVWKYNSEEYYGGLTQELALKQIDTTLYGALISSNVIFGDHYDNDLKYYQHFRILNSVTADTANDVVGVPKLLFTLNYDLSFKNVDEKEKVANYKKAAEPWTKQRDQVVVTAETINL